MLPGSTTEEFFHDFPLKKLQNPSIGARHKSSEIATLFATLKKLRPSRKTKTSPRSPARSPVASPGHKSQYMDDGLKNILYYHNRFPPRTGFFPPLRDVLNVWLRPTAGTFFCLEQHCTHKYIGSYKYINFNIFFAVHTLVK